MICLNRRQCGCFTSTHQLQAVSASPACRLRCLGETAGPWLWGKHLLRRFLLQHAHSAVTLVLIWLHSMPVQLVAALGWLLGCHQVQKPAIHWAAVGDGLALHVDTVPLHLAAEQMRWVTTYHAQARCQDLLVGPLGASPQQVSLARPWVGPAAAAKAPDSHDLLTAQLYSTPPLPAVLKQALPLAPVQRLQRAHCRPVC